MPLLLRFIITITVVQVILANSSLAAVLPLDVSRALQENAEHVTNLHISGSRDRRILGDSATILKELGTRESPATFSQRVLFEIDVKANQFYEQYKVPASTLRSGTGVDKRSFDGKQYFRGSVDPSSVGGAGALSIHNAKTLLQLQKEQQFPSATTFDLWYLLAAGFTGPQEPASLGSRVQSLPLALIKEGSLISFGASQIDKRKVFELEVRYPDPWALSSDSEFRAEAFDELRGDSAKLQKQIANERRALRNDYRIGRFVLDPALNYAVVQFDERRASSGEALFRTINSDFIDTGNGLWLPRKCEINGHAYETRPGNSTEVPAYITTLSIDEVAQREFGDEHFRIVFDIPGVSVEDYTHEKAKPNVPYSFIVPISADQLLARDPLHSKAWFRSALVWINVVFIATLLFYLFWRWRKAH